jgi:hypothetical protein
LKEPEASERRALANSLKPIIAAPPDTLTIERKGLHPYDMVNRVFVLAFTNHQVSITLETQDRRWFCIWSDAPKMTEAEGKALWGWYKAGGMARVARWLQERDVAAFSPKATPMTTEFKLRLIDKSRTLAESYIVEQIEKPSIEFAFGVIASPVHRICNSLQQGSPNGAKIVPVALYHALKEAGWIDLGMVKSADFQTKKNLWVRPDMVKTFSKSDLRRMVEQAPEPGLKLVS